MPYNGMLILAILVGLSVGVAVGYVVKQRLSRKKIESSENLSVRIIDEAKKEAETIKKEAILQAKENLLKVKTEFERDTRDRKVELDALERRLRS
ncbi:MAG: Rnase Y domain-containing protein, partial [Syntrophales bacterium]|nr:Rnase Y domain-containing protein [Syntrophales bacterium]